MREIVSGVRRVNISWSCDSREPVSQYQLMYRDNKVRLVQRQSVYYDKPETKINLKSLLLELLILHFYLYVVRNILNCNFVFEMI